METPSTARLSKNDVYPQRKSELEIFLDHFFNSEDRITGNDRLRRLAEETNTFQITLPPLQFEGLLDKTNIHPSWNSEEYAQWTYLVKKDWVDSHIANKIKLSFNLNDTYEIQIESIVQKLYKYFCDHKINRSANLNFDVTVTPKLTKKLAKLINQSCKRIWDGTINLPYSDNDIFLIIAKYIWLEIYENKNDRPPSLSKEKMIWLELTNDYGSITRCWASPSKIVSAFREDLSEILSDNLDQINSEVLLKINQANLIFDFNKLINLFKDETLPYQVLHNSEKQNPVIFYTPTQITILGYA